MSFLSIKIPNNIAQNISKIDLPGKKEDSSELHITVCYIGKNIKIDQICKILEATEQITSKFKPFTITAGNITCFTPRNDDPYPIILEVESEKLHELNKKLKEKFDEEKIEYSKTFKDYHPHITLSYSKEKVKDRKIGKIEFEVPEIIFDAGDVDRERFLVTFPLHTTKSSNLINRISLFSWAAKG